MIYYLRAIFTISAIILVLLMFIILIIGYTSEKLKSITANAVIAFFVLSCVVTVSALITDIIYY